MQWGCIMTLHEIKDVLLWCTGINYALLLFWVSIFIFAHDGLYRLHTRWFKISAESFDVMNYAGIGIYKLGIILLNLVPVLGLCLAS
jgi:hypothetical protein